MGVIGAPLYHGDAILKKHLHVPEPPIYGKMVGLPVFSVLTMGSPHIQSRPHINTIF